MKAVLGILVVLVGYFVGTMLLGLGGIELPIASVLMEVLANTAIGLVLLGVFAGAFAFVKPSPDAHAEP